MMKTILATIFAIALMVFAFNPSISMANEKSNDITRKILTEPLEWLDCLAPGKPVAECNEAIKEEFSENESDNNESEIADSGEEGSTSAAGADEQ